MRDAGLSKFARVSFADRELLQARKALTLSAAAASQLQQTLSASTAPPLAKAAQIASAYKVMDIPGKR